MKKQECCYILLQGIFLINILFFALLISSVLFMFNISISSVNLLLAVLCSIAVTFYFSGCSVKKTAITTAVGLLIIGICVFLCMHIYDCSWDGNTYRKTRTGLLKYGWSPLYETFFEFAAANLPDIDTTGLWFDRASFASEIIAATFYSLNNNIESGKCYTIISAIALFCISYSFLTETKKIKKWQSICCSLAIVFNPVVVAQCVTNYNDAFLGIILTLCAVALLYLTFYENKRYDWLSWYFVFISINIGFNIKLSMGLFLAILSISICLYWFFLKNREIGLYKTILYYRKHFCLFCFSVFSGFFITGSTYFLRNTIYFGSPFGGFVTSGGGTLSEEITRQLPKVYKNLSNFMRFFCSLFSRSESKRGFEKIEFKFPLTFDAAEIASAQTVDIRTAGWGIFFSGIFLISVLVIFFYLIKKNSLPLKLKHVTILWLLVFVLSICFVPGLSWARYNIVPFWFPVAAMIFIFIDTNKKQSNCSFMPFIAGMIAILLFLNITPNIVRNYALIKDYKSVYNELLSFKAVTENNDVVVDVDDYGFYGRFFNLYDMGINKFYRGDVDPANCSGKIFGGYSLFYNIVDGIVTKNNFKDFLNYLYDKDNYIILLAVKDEASNALTEDIIKDVRSLGLDFDLLNHYRWSYLAAIDGGMVLYENLANENIQYQSEIDGNTISMQSAGYGIGNVASIKINNIEYSLNRRGLNIVVYDKKAGLVVDSVCVDTYENNLFSR